MTAPRYATRVLEPRPETKSPRAEPLPDNPDDPCGVQPQIVEEIEEIGRKNSKP